MDKVAFHIISHTHWDREWYLPFETFRIELIELIDNLLNILEHNKDFIFHLDGQSIILQDYLEIKPDKTEQIKQLVKSGNLLIGPWYVLSDLFLTSGEAIIRNLLYGIRLAKELGSVMLVGYLVDQFGQIAQLPQIFKGFNIQSSVIGRGIQDGIAEHIWYGLNGDSMLAISLTHWYNNAQRLPEGKEKLDRFLNKIYETQHTTTISRQILLMNGGDHLFPQKNITEIIQYQNGDAKWQVEQSSLPVVLDKILKNNSADSYPIVFGELRDDNNKYILSGTLSSRVYLKLANYECQTKLEKIIEPLSVLTILTKSTNSQNLIKYAWKLLLQNHAHDSICGCSIDEVHKEMEVRFLKVNQVLAKIQANLLSRLNYTKTQNRDDTSLHLYLQIINLTNYYRNEVIETELEFPLGPQAEHPSATPTISKSEIKNINLKLDGKIIYTEVLSSYRAYKMVRLKDEVPLLQAVQKIKILFEANIKPFSVQSYEIDTEGSSKEKKLQNNNTSFENQTYKLVVNKDGTLSIFLKNPNAKFENIHFVVIEDDLGDEYNFVPDKKSKIISSESWKWDIKTIEETNFRKKFLLTAKDIIDIQSEITCYHLTERIDFKTRINNQLKNKRIRLHFLTQLNTNYLNADTPFGILQRARPPQDWINYAFSQPIYNWIDHSDGKSGLAFLGGGLSDYELYENGNGFAITLIRAIERLSTVKSHSLIQTPGAQCNREIEFSYAIYAHLGDWKSALVHKMQNIYQTPLIKNQADCKLNVDSLLSVTNTLIVSSLKPSEDTDNLFIFRLFNPYDEVVSDCMIKLNFLHKAIYKLNLNEEIENKIEHKNEHFTFHMQPFQILTFGIEI